MYLNANVINANPTPFGQHTKHAVIWIRLIISSNTANADINDHDAEDEDNDDNEVAEMEEEHDDIEIAVGEGSGIRCGS